MAKFPRPGQTVAEYRAQLLEEASKHCHTPGNDRLSRLNLMNVFKVLALRKATGSKVFPDGMGIYPTQLTGKANNRGCHRMGWDTLLMAFDRLGYEITFVVRPKEEATGNAAGGSVPGGEEAPSRRG